VITLDTSAIFALLFRGDPTHDRVRAALVAERGQFLFPVSALGELAYLVESRLSGAALDAFLGDVEIGNYRMDCGEADIPRIRHLVRRYAISHSVLSMRP